jgi:hypothetical protein
LGDKYRRISFKRKTHCFNKYDEIFFLLKSIPCRPREIELVLYMAMPLSTTRERSEF